MEVVPLLTFQRQEMVELNYKRTSKQECDSRQTSQVGKIQKDKFCIADLVFYMMKNVNWREDHIKN